MKYLRDYKLKRTTVTLSISDNMISMISLTENGGFWSCISAELRLMHRAVDRLHLAIWDVEIIGRYYG